MEEDEEIEILLDIKSDLNSWADWFDVYIHEGHACPEIPEDLSSLIFKGGDEEDAEPTWWFANVRLATNYDVEVGEAERFCDLMAATMVAISFCPFCGESLK